jgi:hypothetical protein
MARRHTAFIMNSRRVSGFYIILISMYL